MSALNRFHSISLIDRRVNGVVSGDNFRLIFNNYDCKLTSKELVVMKLP